MPYGIQYPQHAGPVDPQGIVTGNDPPQVTLPKPARFFARVLLGAVGLFGAPEQGIGGNHETPHVFAPDARQVQPRGLACRLSAHSGPLDGSGTWISDAPDVQLPAPLRQWRSPLHIGANILDGSGVWSTDPPDVQIPPTLRRWRSPLHASANVLDGTGVWSTDPPDVQTPTPFRSWRLPLHVSANILDGSGVWSTDPPDVQIPSAATKFTRRPAASPFTPLETLGVLPSDGWGQFDLPASRGPWRRPIHVGVSPIDGSGVWSTDPPDVQTPTAKTWIRRSYVTPSLEPLEPSGTGSEHGDTRTFPDRRVSVSRRTVDQAAIPLAPSGVLPTDGWVQTTAPTSRGPWRKPVYVGILPLDGSGVWSTDPPDVQLPIARTRTTRSTIAQPATPLQPSGVLSTDGWGQTSPALPRWSTWRQPPPIIASPLETLVTLPDLPAAILSAWNTLGLNTLVGPLYYDQAPRGTSGTFVVFNESFDNPKLTMGSGFSQDSRYRFQIVTRDELDAEIKGNLVNGLLSSYKTGACPIPANLEGVPFSAIFYRADTIRPPAPWTDGKPRAIRVMMLRVRSARVRANL